MKILVIHGSMRKGNTYALTQGIVELLSKKPDVEITEIGVAELELPFCCSCHTCLSKGEEYCPHYGITSRVRTALLDYDGVIFSGTTYMRALNAAMKNLLDHFAYLFHRPALFGKHGMVIATSAGVGEKNVAKYMKSVIGQWGINGAIIVTQNTKAHLLDGGGDGFSPKELAKLDVATYKFYEAIKSKRLNAPSAKNIATHNAFRASALSEFSESDCDTQFWSKREFCDKAYPVKAGPFKYLIGAFVYSAAKNMTKAVGRSYKKRKGAIS